MLDILVNLVSVPSPRLTLFLNWRSSTGVSVSDLPITGMTLTRGESRRMSSISTSRSACPVGGIK
jgi:hypothetical protein